MDNNINRQTVYALVSTTEELPVLEQNKLTEKCRGHRIYLPRRYLVCLLTFAGMFLKNSLRANLSVAVVVMTTSYHEIILNNGTTIKMKEFDWTSKEKGYILSSYFYGYMISEFPSGWLAGRFGGRNTFGFEVLCASFCSFLIPLAAGYGPCAIFVCRALIGIFEGGCLPSICNIWSNWAPPAEKTLLITSSMLGGKVSNVICFFLYGTLATSFGWRILFYLPGVVTLLWCVLWFACVTNRPEDDKRISQSELEYIRNSSVQERSHGKIIYPWKSILTSSKLWSAIFGRFCQGWTYFFLATELPSYFNDVWKMNVKDSGLLLMVSFGCGFLIAITCSMLADYLIVGKQYPITLVRKLFYCVAGVGVAVSLFLIGNAISSTTAIIFVTMADCFYAFYYGSIIPAAVDLAPRFSSLIMGMMTTVASIAAVIAPQLTGYVTVTQSKEEWFIPFLISSGLSIAGTVIYLIFGSAEVQPWALNNNVEVKEET